MTFICVCTLQHTAHRAWKTTEHTQWFTGEASSGTVVNKAALSEQNLYGVQPKVLSTTTEKCSCEGRERGGGEGGREGRRERGRERGGGGEGETEREGGRGEEREGGREREREIETDRQTDRQRQRKESNRQHTGGLYSG